MLKIYQQKPVFGVETNIDRISKLKPLGLDDDITDVGGDIEIVETEYNEMNDNAMNYLTSVEGD